MAGLCACYQAIPSFPWRLVGTVVASTLFGFFEMGVVKSYGVLIDELVFQLRSDLGTIGMIVGVFHGISFFLGPLVDVTYKHLTLPGIVAIGLIGGACLSATAFATTVWQMAAGMTVSGSAYAFVMLDANVRFGECVPPKKFALLFSIADTGNAVGMVVGPIFAEFLTKNYGWRVTVLTFGGLYVNIPILLFMMTASVGRTTPRVPLRNPEEDDEAGTAEGSTNSNDCPSCSFPERSHELPVEADIHHVHDCVSDTSSETSERVPLMKDQQLPSSSYKEDAILRVDDIIIDRTSKDDTNDLVTSNGNFDPEGKLPFQCCHRAWLLIQNTFLGTTLTKEPYFLLLHCNNIINGVASTAWVVFLIPHGVSKGYPLARAVFLASFGGTGNIIGRLLSGPILHVQWISAVGMMIALHFINAMVFLLDPLVSPFWLLSLNAFIGGFSLGCKMTTGVIVIKESYPAAKYSSAFALFSFAYSIGQPLGGFLTGWLADLIGYGKAFMFLGLAEIVGCVLLIPFRHYYNRRQV